MDSATRPMGQSLEKERRQQSNQIADLSDEELARLKELFQRIASGNGDEGAVAHRQGLKTACQNFLQVSLISGNTIPTVV